MQITESVQAEIMEMIADDEMHSRELPSEEEIENIYVTARQRDIIAANRLSAETDDWIRDERRIEMGAIAMLTPSHHRPLFYREDTAADHLADIQRENVESSRNNH